MLGFPSTQMPVGYAAGGMYGIPPSPMGNIAQIGSMGYNNDPFSLMMNSPYYSGLTSNFVYQNPYTLARQREAMESARKEQIRKESDTLKAISRGVHRALKDMDEDELENHVKQFNPLEYNHEFEEAVNEVLQYIKLSNLKPTPVDMRRVAYLNQVRKSYKDKYPDDMSLADFFNNAGVLYRDSIFEMKERETRNGQLKYNSAQFNSIVDMHRTASSYFNRSILNGGTIDVGDLEIHLPDLNTGERSKIVPGSLSIQEEYAERRRQFIQTILERGGK